MVPPPQPASLPLPATTTVVVMGASGSGKTTLAHELARRLAWPFAEGDEFHPAANVAKMRSGRPLDDDDRWPWLRAVAGWIGTQEQAETSAVLTCSALKRSYRDLLREGHPSVWFAHVSVDPGVLADRLDHRHGHYMPASLLASQLSTLEPLTADEPGATVDGSGTVDAVVGEVIAALGAARHHAATGAGDPPRE